ncbi:hypothetical protein [Mycobacterium riyadhense]|uniref:hypothetical protein n=1 Tax=Mycobacterium riyadhense TaxID=486698 RepID=UPI00194F45F4
MAFADKVTIENQHFVDAASTSKCRSGQMIKAYGPVLAQLVLTTDDAATFGQYLRGERGSECDVIVKEGKDRILFAGIPRCSRPSTEINRSR